MDAKELLRTVIDSDNSYMLDIINDTLYNIFEAAIKAKDTETINLFTKLKNYTKHIQARFVIAVYENDTDVMKLLINLPGINVDEQSMMNDENHKHYDRL